LSLGRAGSLKIGRDAVAGVSDEVECERHLAELVADAKRRARFYSFEEIETSMRT
jgi:hypothetical protein